MVVNEPTTELQAQFSSEGATPTPWSKAREHLGKRFEVDDGAFKQGDGKALVFEVKPSTVFGFAKGEFSQTRWRF